MFVKIPIILHKKVPSELMSMNSSGNTTVWESTVSPLGDESNKTKDKLRDEIMAPRLIRFGQCPDVCQEGYIVLFIVPC